MIPLMVPGRLPGRLPGRKVSREVSRKVSRAPVLLFNRTEKRFVEHKLAIKNDSTDQNKTKLLNGNSCCLLHPRNTPQK